MAGGARPARQPLAWMPRRPLRRALVRCAGSACSRCAAGARPVRDRCATGVHTALTAMRSGAVAGSRSAGALDAAVHGERAGDEHAEAVETHRPRRQLVDGSRVELPVDEGRPIERADLDVRKAEGEHLNGSKDVHGAGDLRWARVRWAWAEGRWRCGDVGALKGVPMEGRRERFCANAGEPKWWGASGGARCTVVPR